MSTIYLDFDGQPWTEESSGALYYYAGARSWAEAGSVPTDARLREVAR